MSKKFTKGNFNTEVIGSEIPVLVDFWAEWCGPCKMVAPTIDSVAKELEGKVKVGKVNVDEEPDLAGEYGVMSIPTFMLFKGGAPVHTFTGALPKESLMAQINPYIGKKK
jgi:thioredoxin 1